MADFQAHVNQAKRNLAFLVNVNLQINDSWDWQVTSAYYTAVHLVNAHIAQAAGLHYTTHEKVKNAIFQELSIAKVPDDIYTSYVKLENLSRRARYLCHEDKSKGGDGSNAFITHDKHLKKALQKLDTLMSYFDDLYKLNFPVSNIDCIELRATTLRFFKYSVKAFSA